MKNCAFLAVRKRRGNPAGSSFTTGAGNLAGKAFESVNATVLRICMVTGVKSWDKLLHINAAEIDEFLPIRGHVLGGSIYGAIIRRPRQLVGQITRTVEARPCALFFF